MAEDLFIIKEIRLSPLFRTYKYGRKVTFTSLRCSETEHNATDSDSVDDRVERRGRTHCCRSFRFVGLEVASDILCFAFNGHQFGHDLIFVFRQRFGDRREFRSQFRIVGFRQRLRPVLRQIEVRRFVVRLAGGAARRLVVVQVCRVRFIQRRRQRSEFRARMLLLDIAERLGQCQKLAE